VEQPRRVETERLRAAADALGPDLAGAQVKSSSDGGCHKVNPLGTVGLYRPLMIGRADFFGSPFIPVGQRLSLTSGLGRLSRTSRR
jgi:hypothetical protein